MWEKTILQNNFPYPGLCALRGAEAIYPNEPVTHFEVKRVPG